MTHDWKVGGNVDLLNNQTCSLPRKTGRYLDYAMLEL